MAGNPRQQFITRKQLQDLLRSEGLRVGDSTLRRYQALGLVQPPRRYGRKGRGRGVDWGWPPQDAAEIVRRVTIIRRHQSKGTRLLRLITVDPEMAADFDEVMVKERDIAYKQGYADGADDTRRELESQVHEYLEGQPRRPTEGGSGASHADL